MQVGMLVTGNSDVKVPPKGHPRHPLLRWAGSDKACGTGRVLVGGWRAAAFLEQGICWVRASLHKPPSTAWRPWTRPVHRATPLSSPDFMKGLLAGRLWAGLWRKNSQEPTAPLGSRGRGRGRTCHFSYESKDESRAAPPLAWPLHGEKCPSGRGWRWEAHGRSPKCCWGQQSIQRPCTQRGYIPLCGCSECGRARTGSHAPRCYSSQNGFPSQVPTETETVTAWGQLARRSWEPQASPLWH